MTRSRLIFNKDKRQRAKEKNENSTSIYMNWAESRLDSSFIDLRLQKFAHITEMIKTELLKLD